jgi:hypothetical protein
VSYALQSLNPTLDLSFFPKSSGYDTHRERMTGVFSVTLSLCDDLDRVANHSKSQISDGIIHFDLLNSSNIALPSMFLTSNLHLENASLVAQVHGIGSREAALLLISSVANDVYQACD